MKQKISVAKEHLSKEEIKEYSILYIMFNYSNIISPRAELLVIFNFRAVS